LLLLLLWMSAAAIWKALSAVVVPPPVLPPWRNQAAGERAGAEINGLPANSSDVLLVRWSEEPATMPLELEWPGSNKQSLILFAVKVCLP
jgi:hypothetical protein